MATKPSIEYENNPFYIALNGLQKFFKLAQPVAVLMVVLSVIAFFSQLSQEIFQPLITQKGNDITFNAPQLFGQTTSDMVVLGVVVSAFALMLVVIGVTVRGIIDYTSAQLAVGKSTTIKTAFKQVIERFGSYFLLQLLIFIKLVLWSLLLVVPGIIKSVRYDLSGVVFFQEGKTGNAATKRSEELVSGGWMTTFATHTLWNVMTLGAIELVLTPGTRGELYRQFQAALKADVAKPAAHWLSQTVFWVVIALASLFLLLLLIGITIATVISITNMT